ncbi:MAG TPA: hypothetical protein VJK72_04730 [Candidatus Nanoarchaeia archaeon]|nr:hypothetical protein [Candidatus Nanoarchaeia archaeon]
MQRGFEMPHERKRRMSKTRRDITLLAVVFSLFVVGYIAVSTGDGELINTAAISPLGEPASGLFQVSGELTIPEISLDVDDVTLVIISNDQAVISLNGLEVDHVQGPLVFQGYEGEINVEGNHVSFDGSARSAVVDQVAINGNVAVSSAMDFEQLEIGDLKQKRLSITGTGTLEVVGRGTFTVSDAVDIRLFDGTLTFADMMTLKGKAEKVVVESEPKISVE